MIYAKSSVLSAAAECVGTGKTVQCVREDVSLTLLHGRLSAARNEAAYRAWKAALVANDSLEYERALLKTPSRIRFPLNPCRI